MKKDDNSGVSIKQIMITTLFLVVTVLGGFKAYGIVYGEDVNTIQNIESANLENLGFEVALVENTEDDFVYSENIKFLAGKVIQASGDLVEITNSNDSKVNTDNNFSEKNVSRGTLIRNQVAANTSDAAQNKLLNAVLNEIKELSEKQEMIESISLSGEKASQISGDKVQTENSDELVAENIETNTDIVEKIEESTSVESTANIAISVPPTEYLKTIDVKATAYCLCKKCCGKSPSNPAYGITASGLKIVPGTNMKVVASDPKVIPLGTEVYIEGLYGAKDYGYAIVADTGSAIKNLKIDLYMDTHQMALNWGVKTVRVYILDK